MFVFKVHLSGFINIYVIKYTEADLSMALKVNTPTNYIQLLLLYVSST